MSSRTSFARCSNFLLSQKRSDTTVIADRVSPGGLGMSGSGWSRQGRTSGTSGSFSSTCLVLRILVWVAMSKRRRMRIDVICELFQTLLTVEVRARSIRRPMEAGMRVHIIRELFKTLLEGFAVRRGRSLCLLCSPLGYRQWERRTRMARGVETCEVMVSTDC